MKNYAERFNSLEDLPISEETLGAYLEGNLSQEEETYLSELIESDPDLYMINDLPEIDFDDIVFPEEEFAQFELPDLDHIHGLDPNETATDPYDIAFLENFDDPESIAYMDEYEDDYLSDPIHIQDMNYLTDNIHDPDNINIEWLETDAHYEPELDSQIDWEMDSNGITTSEYDSIDFDWNRNEVSDDTDYDTFSTDL